MLRTTSAVTLVPRAKAGQSNPDAVRSYFDLRGGTGRYDNVEAEGDAAKKLDEPEVGRNTVLAGQKNNAVLAARAWSVVPIINPPVPDYPWM